MKVKFAFKNIIWGLTSQLISIAFGILIPRIFILNLGSETNGFMSSISQLLVYMSILEAGVGAASIQALYKPIALNDKESINGILSATSKYYKKTGTYYFISVIVMAALYSYFIQSDIDVTTTFLVIMLTGMAGVLNYFFQAKYKLLLTAEGKGYILSNITIMVTILANVVKILLLLNYPNIILIQLSYFLVNIIQMILVLAYIRKKYAWIDLSAKPNYPAIAQKNSALVHQISGMIFGNTDVVILTIFCGLKVVSIYVIYSMVFGMVNMLVSNVNSGIVFILGSEFHKSKERFLTLYDAYEVYFSAAVFSLYAVAYILILPFMRLYTAGITDVNYIDVQLPILFVILNLLSLTRGPANNVINIAGHFKLTQYRSIFESIINIVVSILCVNQFGIYGVLVGTIVALLYRTNDMIIYTNKKILDRSSIMTYKRLFLNTGLFLLILRITKLFNVGPDTYSEFIIMGLILSAIIIPLFFIVASLFDKKSFHFVFGYFKTLVKNKRKA